MKVGDKCRYRARTDVNGRGVYKPGVVVKVIGPFSAKVYTIIGTGYATGELVTKTSHYVMEEK